MTFFYSQKLNSNPKILVCPLDWGIGHATRCVPVIRELKSQGAEVIIGADNGPKSFLAAEFPDIQIIDFPGHKITYSKKGGGLMFQLMLQLPAMLRWVKKENSLMHQLINEFKINGVISDNRFGLYSNTVPSIFMTHQVFLKTNLPIQSMDNKASELNLKLINKYQKLWIPDFEGSPNLSGELSHRSPLPDHGRFIGILSRFQGQAAQHTAKVKSDKVWDACVILSGPEPQRTILEQKVLEEIKDSDLAVIIAGGQPGNETEVQQIGRSYIYPHLSTLDLLKAIKSSDVIISRSGYSTVMDLVIAGGNAVLVPTPGQPEQLYLGKYLQDQGWFACVHQEDFSLRQAMALSKKYKAKKLEPDPQLLEGAVTEFLNMI